MSFFQTPLFLDNMEVLDTGHLLKLEEKGLSAKKISKNSSLAR